MRKQPAISVTSKNDDSVPTPRFEANAPPDPDATPKHCSKCGGTYVGSSCGAWARDHKN